VVVRTSRLRRGALLLGLALALVAGCGDDRQLEAGRPVPGFRLQRLDGTTLAFPEELRGRVVAVRFWADWCPFCASEMHALEPLYREYRDRGLSILAVNVRQDRDTAWAFVDDLGVSYPVLLDPEGAVARSYGVVGLPSTFFVDRDGRLRRRILGEAPSQVFEAIVKDLL
jgi:peroxiredoxin